MQQHVTLLPSKSIMISITYHNNIQFPEKQYFCIKSAFVSRMKLDVISSKNRVRKTNISLGKTCLPLHKKTKLFLGTYGVKTSFKCSCKSLHILLYLQKSLNTSKFFLECLLGSKVGRCISIQVGNKKFIQSLAHNVLNVHFFLLFDKNCWDLLGISLIYYSFEKRESERERERERERAISRKRILIFLVDDSICIM